MVYKRTVTRFIADDKVVYQRVRRKMRLASDKIWARRRLKRLSWRSRWIIMCTLEWRMAAACEISRADRCLFDSRSSTDTRSTAGWLPDCRPTRLAYSLQQTVDASKFPTRVWKFTQHHFCTILLLQIEICNQNRMFMWNFHDFVYFLLILRYWQFPKVK